VPCCRKSLRQELPRISRLSREAPASPRDKAATWAIPATGREFLLTGPRTTHIMCSMKPRTIMREDSRTAPAADLPLMAQAVADAVGATKRQIQFWTDRGVLMCPGPLHPSRGQQRLYGKDELRFAAIARYLTKYKMPVEELKRFTDFVRSGLRGRLPDVPTDRAGRVAEWCQAAWRGEIDSSILYRGEQEPIWFPSDGILKLLRLTDGAVVLNVHRIMAAIN
jgi:DNA-binding transcriptional MerR regulator